MNNKNEQATDEQRQSERNDDSSSKKSVIDYLAKEPTMREQDLNRGNLSGNGEPTLIYPSADQSKKQ
jgi:hypothetical protein